MAATLTAACLAGAAVEPTVLSPDMNGDGVTNYFDIIDFLEAWHGSPE